MTDPDLTFESSMSDAEALMWNIEKDPWLNPSGSMVITLDRPLDIDKFRRRMAKSVLTVPRLHQRVEPGFGPTVEAADEGSVYFQPVHRQPGHIAESCVASSEIVQVDMKADKRQPVDCGHDRVVIALDQCGFQHFVDKT